MFLKIIYILILFSSFGCNKFINHFVPDSSGNEFTTGVKGQVFISPVSPFEREGVINKAPYEAFLKFVDLNKDTIKKIQTDVNGKFKVALDSGNYTIIPESITNTGTYPIGEMKNIIIKSGEIAFVEIDFDSGIR